MIKLNINSPLHGQFSKEFATEQDVTNYVNECAASNKWGEGVEYSVQSLVEEKLNQQRMLESMEAMELGHNLRAKIRMINRRKLKTGIWSQEDFAALLVNPTAANVRMALIDGSLTTARFYLLQMSNIYSDIEIKMITDEIDAHEQKWSSLI